MSADPYKNKQITQYPEGDILHNYSPDNSPSKFEYLQGKYIFRFPFTLTAMKWGLSLGTFFALHTYFKTSFKKILKFISYFSFIFIENPINSVYWFVFGSMFTGLPIWYKK